MHAVAPGRLTPGRPPAPLVTFAALCRNRALGQVVVVDFGTTLDYGDDDAEDGQCSPDERVVTARGAPSVDIPDSRSVYELGF
jgi:hypothetical protein